MVVGSVIAALSPGIIGIIVGRTLQGAIVGVVPLGISIMRDVLHEDRVDSAIAFMSATLGVGGALGLPISALVTERSDWHVLFWVAAGLGVVVFALVLWIVPVSVLRTAGRFDFVGAAGLAIGLVGILLAISRGNEWGWTSPIVLACGLGGIAVLLLWGWFELRIDEPLLDLRVAARPAVLLTNIASMAMGFSLFASNVVYPQLLELPVATGAGFGLSLLAASLIVMPSGLVMMVLSPIAGRIASRTGPKLLLLLGAISLIAAYGFTLLFSSEVWHILVANILIGAGIGFGYAVDADAHHALGAAERDGCVERSERAVPLPRNVDRRGGHRRGAGLVLGGLQRHSGAHDHRLHPVAHPGRRCRAHRARRGAVHSREAGAAGAASLAAEVEPSR